MVLPSPSGSASAAGLTWLPPSIAPYRCSPSIARPALVPPSGLPARTCASSAAATGVPRQNRTYFDWSPPPMKMPSARFSAASTLGSLADSRSLNTKVSTDSMPPTSLKNSSPISPPCEARRTTMWPLPAFCMNQRSASKLRSPPPISSRPPLGLPGAFAAMSPST